MIEALSSQELFPLRTLAAEIKQEWAGEPRPPDARAAFKRHPELLSVKSIFLDLAYEEYCRRRQNGEDVDPNEFCDQFPRHRIALLQLIETHLYMAQADALLESTPLDFWPDAGEEVAGFTIRRELGRGTFARVYLATEATAGDRPVALKMTFEGGAEGCILGRLPHPNVVHVNSVGEDEATGLTRLCMPFLGSATLHDLLRRAYPTAGALPPRRAAVILEAVAAAVGAEDPPPHIEPGALTPSEVLKTGSYSEGVAELGRQIADALSFVHQCAVYHRDLKPTNVLLTPGGRPVLLDFNLSNDGRFASARLGGTLPYMAPEQLRALLGRGIVPAGSDGRADLFSLGVILYELLTGRLPFGPPPPLGLSVPDASRAQLALQSRACVSVCQHNPAVHPLLARAVERCLALRPEERHADAASLARALSDYQTRTRPAPRRSFRRWAFSVGAAVLLLAVGLAANGRMRPGDDAPPKKVAPTARDLDVQGHDAMIAGRDDSAITLFQAAEAQRKADGVSPDGRTLACIAFCWARSGNNENAVVYSQKAKEAGYINAAVHNNEGVALLRATKADTAAAYLALTHAIDCDPTMVEPRQNRAKLSLSPNATAPRLKEAREDLDTALDVANKNGSPRAELFYNAAQLSCLAKEPAVALGHIQGAVECGAPPSYLRADPFLAGVLRGRPEILPPAGGAVEVGTLPQIFPLVDPTRGEQ